MGRRFGVPDTGRQIDGDVRPCSHRMSAAWATPTRMKRISGYRQRRR